MFRKTVLKIEKGILNQEFKKNAKLFLQFVEEKISWKKLYVGKYIFSRIE
jgi:hypothetical protein